MRACNLPKAGNSATAIAIRILHSRSVHQKVDMEVAWKASMGNRNTSCFSLGRLRIGTGSDMLFCPPC